MDPDVTAALGGLASDVGKTVEITERMIDSFHSLASLATEIKNQRDRLADVGERILPILDKLCETGFAGSTFDEDHFWSLRAELVSVLRDVQRGVGE